jgi:hypothetical protein
MKRSDAQMIVRAISRTLKAQLAIRDARIAALEAHVKSLPTGLNFRGPFKDGDEFTKGDLVVFNGSLWYCGKATAARPNDSQSDAWTLCAKRGRDAR